MRLLDQRVALDDDRAGCRILDVLGRGTAENADASEATTWPESMTARALMPPLSCSPRS